MTCVPKLTIVGRYHYYYITYTGGKAVTYSYTGELKILRSRYKNTA